MAGDMAHGADQVSQGDSMRNHAPHVAPFWPVQHPKREAQVNCHRKGKARCSSSRLTALATHFPLPSSFPAIASFLARHHGQGREREEGPRGQGDALEKSRARICSIPLQEGKMQGVLRLFFSPTAESFGVSGQIGSGVVWGGPEVRFHQGSTRGPCHQGSTRVPPGFARAAGWSGVV